ncbi:MAG TPA: UDP-N-acetylglucosamine 2-epimerase (hydrolyzing) [Rhodospirillales bacterium]|nr:UDP-N-acetylglucosamine 2-epimerase (hydrolyzing) [Rhodospirillales bacterium]
MKLLFLNGSRGEWGYIRPIIKLCQKRGIDYSICATNMLLLPGYGNLAKEIQADGFRVDDEIYMALEGDNHVSMTKSLAVFMGSFVDVINRIKPTWIVLAGDRGEQTMAALAGAYMYTPVCHIQAGERSGNIDGVARHAIGKFAHLHLAANEDAAERLIKLGEQPFRVHMVGAPQLDELVTADYASADDLAAKYGVAMDKPYFLVVQHPVTEEMDKIPEQVSAMLNGLAQFDHPKIWILPNNDAGGAMLRKELLQQRDGSIAIFDNLTRRDYLGFMRHCAAVIGNSSSGLLEAPTFKIGAVNIGRRQADRTAGSNVIDARDEAKSIAAAIGEVLSPAFQDKLQDCVNPYGDGKSSDRILNVLENTPIDESLLIKRLTY